jgi:hypothetical protein
MTTTQLEDLPSSLLKTMNVVLSWLQFPLPHDQHGFPPAQAGLSAELYPYEPARKPYGLYSGELHILEPYSEQRFVVDAQVVEWIVADIHQAILAAYEPDPWALMSAHLWQAGGTPPRPRDEGESAQAFLLRLKHWLVEYMGEDREKAEQPAEHGFTFKPGQALYKGKDLELPAGFTIDVCRLLVKSMGEVVAYKVLDDGLSTNKEASEILRRAKSKIDASFDKQKVPYLIVTKRCEGYCLSPK